jgi:8-oxo-dGTP pyrophosphatase MutT (NUDIX family)
VTVQFDLDAPPVVPRDAATVVLLRDGAAGLEVFFVKRHANVRFMGGAYVFPGGKLDPADRDPALPCDLDDATAAGRLGDDDNDDPGRARALHVAALRECLEEAGVLFVREPCPASVVAAVRADASTPDTLARVLAARGLTLRASALVPFARWITPRGETRRFDARFFLAVAPADAHARHDESETVDSAWLTPREALARAERGEIVLAPPTHRTAALLEACRNVADALDLAPAPIPEVEPAVVLADTGEILIVLPGDPLHRESTAPRMVRAGAACTPRELPTRFVYDNGSWRAVEPAR